MKKKYLLFGTFMVAVMATINVKTVNSKVAAPPAGSVGDPFTTVTCIQSGCHNGTAEAPVAGVLTLGIGTNQPTGTLNNSFQYTPGVTYNLGFSLNNVSTGIYGFQVGALKPDNTMAGSFAVISTVNTSISTLNGGRQYIGHKNASSNKTWVFKWTAPAVATPVTFYYAYNTGNNDNLPSGDQIYKGTVTINATGTGLNDITDKVADLNIFPNPISNNFGVSFNLKEANQVSAQLYNLDGKLVKELINEKMGEGAFNQQFNAGELSAGIYVVKMNVGEASVSKKIIKL